MKYRCVLHCYSEVIWCTTGDVLLINDYHTKNAVPKGAQILQSYVHTRQPVNLRLSALEHAYKYASATYGGSLLIKY
jgi:hypothetical protein